MLSGLMALVFFGLMFFHSAPLRAQDQSYAEEIPQSAEPYATAVPDTLGPQATECRSEQATLDGEATLCEESLDHATCVEAADKADDLHACLKKLSRLLGKQNPPG